MQQSECVACSQQVRSGPKPVTFIVVGDYPYSAKQLRDLPAVVSEVNSDPDIDLVFHVGDIKPEKLRSCRHRYYRHIKSNFDAFRDPLLYTFGDNEWLDCPQSPNSIETPLGHLADLRRIFFPSSHTLGRHVRAESQQRRGMPENVSFVRRGVSYAVFNASGAGNGHAPSGRGATTDSALRVDARTRSEAAVRIIDRAFAKARKQRCHFVLLFTHADMFHGSPGLAYETAYGAIARALARNSNRFPGKVYLFNGDSHQHRVDQPLSSASTPTWRRLYQSHTADNLTTITVSGARNAKALKVTLIREPAIIDWHQQPLASTQ
jgi:hypothetical protein